jgi:hypothetical protein
MNKDICIIQLADYKHYEERKNCVESVRAYCRKNKIQWIGLTGTLDKNTHIAYQKPLAILRELHKFKYVGWIDMDVVITNSKFDLYSYLEANNNGVTVCRDPAFFNQNTANSGVMFYRNNFFCKKFLEEWWSMRQIGVDKHWRHQAGNGDADQTLLNILLKKYNLEIQNPHDLNIHPKHYQKGDFAIHFMGHKTIDYESFVELANTIDDDFILQSYWMIYSFQSYDLIDRYYEYGRQDLMRATRYSPQQVLSAAKSLRGIEVPH